MQINGTNFNYRIDKMLLVILVFFLVQSNFVWVWAATEGHGSHLHHGNYVPQSRIIGGKPVHPKVIPYMVKLTITRTKIGLDASCGGSLISEKHIVTAAHCFGTDGVVKLLEFGAYKNEGDEKEKFTYTTNAASYVIHPEYNLNIFAHDIAIIKLSKPADLNPKYVWPVRLFDPAVESYVGETVQAYGWGDISDKLEEPTELMGVNLTVIDSDSCRSQLKEGMETEEPYLYDYEMCTSGTDQDTSDAKGACHGDSGGPLVFNETLIGVAVRVGHLHGKCTLKYPTVFVSVREKWSWIYQEMLKP